MAKRKRAKQSRKVSPNKQAYRKEQQRIQRFIGRAEKRGYQFPAWSIPQEPNRVYKRDIETLKLLTPERLFAEAIYINKDTGETITGTERRAQERKEAAAKGQRTRKEKQNKGAPPTRGQQILAYIQNQIAEYETRYPKGRWCGRNNFYEVGLNLRDFINGLIAEVGLDEVLRRLETHPEVQEVTDVILYDSSDTTAKQSLNQLIETLTGGTLTAQQAEQFGEDSDYNDDLDELPL